MSDRDLVVMLMGSAYNTYRASLCAGPPYLTELLKEIVNPKPGDIVMETSTLRMKGHDLLEGIGRLVSISNEPTCTREEWIESGGGETETIPTRVVYTLELIFDDSRLFRWSNASFIKVKTDVK